jgi:hypothetical protein
MPENLTFLLLRKLLDVVKESGANRTEAGCALNAAVAMIPDLDLEVKAQVYQTPYDTGKRSHPAA